MPPRPASPKPAAKKQSTARGDGDTTAREGGAKKPAAKRKVKGTARAEEDGAEGEGRGPERVRVFMKIASDKGSSVSSCVACDDKTNSAYDV